VKKYVLDTNLYVQAFRDREKAAGLERFYAAYTRQSYLSSIVLHELLAGANTPEKARQIDQEIARPFKRTARLIAPIHADWESSAAVLARMGREEGLEIGRTPKSLVNDVLLAASCRTAGVALVTDNRGDFERIRGFLRFDFVLPWPGYSI
jgi:predicted nucleic acid-binding protein